MTYVHGCVLKYSKIINNFSAFIPKMSQTKEDIKSILDEEASSVSRECVVLKSDRTHLVFVVRTKIVIGKLVTFSVKIYGTKYGICH